MRRRLGVAALGSMAIFSCWTGISHAQAMHDPGPTPGPALHKVSAGQVDQMRIKELAREVHSSRNPGKLHQLIQELQSMGKKENDPKLRQQMTHLEEQARLQLMQFNRPADLGSHQQAKGAVGLKTSAAMQSTNRFEADLGRLTGAMVHERDETRLRALRERAQKVYLHELAGIEKSLRSASDREEKNALFRQRDTLQQRYQAALKQAEEARLQTREHLAPPIGAAKNLPVGLHARQKDAVQALQELTKKIQQEADPKQKALLVRERSERVRALQQAR